MSTPLAVAWYVGMTALCLWVAVPMARRKDRSEINWVVLTVLFGPVAVLALHVSERARLNA
jgi:hypothetical protein